METNPSMPSFRPPSPEMRADMPPGGGQKAGFGTEQPDFMRLQQQEQMRREMLMGEREPLPYLEIKTLGLLRQLEKAEGGRYEEGAVEWPLTIQLQDLASRKVGMETSIPTLVNYGGAQHIGDEENTYYINVPPSFGFGTTFVDLGEPVGTQIAVNLGTEKQRGETVKRIEGFTDNVYARMKFANLYGHLFKRSIESINNLATLYLASVDIAPKDIRSLLTLPAAPEDTGKELKNEGGVKYENNTALGQMIITSMQIFNAVGLSEKRTFFKDFISKKGWNNVVASGGNKDNVMKEWFGSPDQWKVGIADRSNWGDGSLGRTSKEWEMEASSRGELTKWGNIFVRDEDFEKPRLFREEVVKFLGGTETAKQAVELAWKNFRLWASADMVGYEWYRGDDGKPHAAIALGGDVSGDFGKVVHPDAYLEFYHKNDRGAVPRGAYGKIHPYAVDVTRAMVFGDGYKLPDGVVVDRPSLHDLLFIHGLKGDQVDYNKLSDRAICGPYLRFFMAACGDEYGKGSFDMATEKIASPEPFLSPAFWEKFWSKLHVGITKENVAWDKFLKNEGSVAYALPSKLPGQKPVDEFREFKLEHVRTLLDGIIADESSISWDTADKRPIRGIEKISMKGEKGLPVISGSDFVTTKIIDTANEAISGLDYTKERRKSVREKYFKSLSFS